MYVEPLPFTVALLPNVTKLEDGVVSFQKAVLVAT
jgi:hypothetical protein